MVASFARWAAIYGALGEKDKAFAELEKALEERDWEMHRLSVELYMRPLRDDPRFKAMLKRVNLPEYNVMKRCPECRRDYYDDTLSFCLNDGTELVYGLTPDEPATAILHSTAAPGEAPTPSPIEAANTKTTADPANLMQTRRLKSPEKHGRKRLVYPSRGVFIFVVFVLWASSRS